MHFYYGFSDKNDTMTEGAEGCSDDSLTSLKLDVASGGGPSSPDSQKPVSQAEVSALCISSADDEQIIAGEWHGGQCLSKCTYEKCTI